MSSETLEEYEEELKALLGELQSSISYQLPRKEGDDRRRTVQGLERKMREAEGLLRDIQTELRRAPRGYQHQATNRVGQYKAELASLRRQLTNGSMREELFSREVDEFADVHPRQGERELLLKNTDTLKRASESVYRAQQVSADTDEVAVGIIEELDDQKASLLRTRKRVHGIDSEMDRTTSLLRSIVCKSIQNRLILIVVIIVELAILVGVAIWKFS